MMRALVVILLFGLATSRAASQYGRTRDSDYHHSQYSQEDSIINENSRGNHRSYENPSQINRDYHTSSSQDRRYQSQGYPSYQGQGYQSPASRGQSSQRSDSQGRSYQSPASRGQSSQRSDSQGQSYQSPDYRGQSYQSPDYRGQSYQSPDYRGQSYQSPDYQGQSYQSPDYRGQSYQSPDYRGQSYQSPDYQGQSYQSPDYRGQSNQRPTYGESNQDYQDRQYPSQNYGSGDDESSSYQREGSRSQSLDMEYIATLQEISFIEDTDNICAQTCSYRGGVSPGTVEYQAGQEYRYQYTGQVSSRLITSSSGGEDESQMSVRAYVVISARTSCDLKMKVMNLAVDDVAPEESKWFRDSVQDHDLHFSYQRGRVEYLCPHDEENVVATNFKRGILSAIQTSIPNAQYVDEAVVEEVDVSGECETRYNYRNEGYWVVEKKKQNCPSHSFLPNIQYQEYDTHTTFGELPFFKSNQSCEMYLRDSVWERIECTEEVKIDDPKTSFFGISSQAYISVSSTLHLEAGPEASHDDFAPDGRRQRREGIKMDLEGAYKAFESRNDNHAVRDQIEMTMEYLSASIPSNSGLVEGRPHAFSELIRLLGRLQQEVELDDLWETYGSQENYREFLIDALMVCDTDHCVRLVTRLAQEDESAVGQARLMTWLAGVHFQNNVYPQSIVYIMELIESDMGVETQALMAVSSLVHRLCEKEPKECRSFAQPFLMHIEEVLGESCGYGESSDHHSQVLLALRALRSAGVLPHDHVPDRCLMNKLLSSEVRVAALQAHRRAGCHHTSYAWQLLEDPSEDIDVRVAAYQSLVPCADEDERFFRKISSLLQKEEVNQVGSYIWTHVRNLAERPDTGPTAREAAALASQVTLNDKFNTNAFRSSRNYHQGFYSSMFDMGGSVDTDIIFTQDSYFPRHASHNLNLDLFGKSFNVLEFGGDFHGIEEIIEKLFEKYNYFENTEMQNLLRNLRPKREIKDTKIEELERLYKENRTVNEHHDEDPKASLFVRVFGNEVVYLDNALQMNPMEFLSALRQFSSPMSMQLLNQEYISPTLIGLPLRLKLNATGSVSFNTDGTSFSGNSWSMLNMKGHLKPSAVLAMDEMLLVEGYGSSSGIRRQCTQVAHADLGGQLTFQDFEVLSAQLDVPSADLAKLSKSSKVQFFKNYLGRWIEADGTSNGRLVEQCSPDILGLEVCSSSTYYENYDSLDVVVDLNNGELSISKLDDHNSYTLELSRRNRNIHFLFDTPGSNVNRKVEAQLNIRPTNVEGFLIIPGKRYDASGDYINTPTSKKLGLQYHKDSELQGEFEISLQQNEEGENLKFVPKFLLSLQDIVDIDINGNLIVEDHSIILEVDQMSSFQENPVELLYSWGKEGDQGRLELSASIGQYFGKSSLIILNAFDKLTVQMNNEYGQDRSSPHTVTLTLDSTHDIVQGETVNQGYLSMQSSQADSNLQMNYKYQQGYAEAVTNVTVKTTQVTSEAFYKNLGDDVNKDFEVKLSFISPQLDVNYVTQAVYKVSEHAFQAEAEMDLGSWVHTKGSVTYLHQAEPLHHLLGLHLQWNDFVIQGSQNIDFSQDNRALVMLSGRVGPAATALNLEAVYDPGQPFNVTLDLHGSFENQHVGLAFTTVSDAHWREFSGTEKLSWFDRDMVISHHITWNSDRKHMKFTCENEGELELTAQTSPDFKLGFILKTDPTAPLPDFQIEVGRKKEEEPAGTTVHSLFTAHGDTLLDLTATVMEDAAFTGNLVLLNSRLEVTGQVSHPGDEELQATAQVTVTLPSRQVHRSDLNLAYVNNGTVKDIMLSCSLDNELMEGHINMVHRDGWFSDDTSAFAFNFNSPIIGMQNFGFAYEHHGDLGPSLPSYVEAHWEELKIRGEADMRDPDDLEISLQYEDGGTCDSHLRFYYEHKDQQYQAGASLGITQAHDPWSIEVVTNHDDTGDENAFDIKATLEAPIMRTPFEAHGFYKVGQDTFDLEAQLGTDEKVTLTLSGKRENEFDTQKLIGLMDFNTPWTSPVHLNTTNTHDSESFNMTLDLKSSIDYINTVAAEFSSSYPDPRSPKAHFYLSHREFQANLEFTQEFSDTKLREQFRGSVSGLTISQEFNAEWDEYYTPTSANGRLSLFNVFGHDIDLSLNHGKEENRFVTQLFGTLDEKTVGVGHTFNMKRPLEWTSVLQVTLPGQEDILGLEMILNAQDDLSALEWNFFLTSPWTENCSGKFIFDMIDSKMTYEFDVLYNGYSVFRSVVESSGSIGWSQSDFSINLISPFLDLLKIKWEHSLETETLFAAEISYGPYFMIEGKHHLRHESSWFSEDDLEYHFIANLNLPELLIHFKSMFDFSKSQISGELDLGWDEYSLLVKSDISGGADFVVSVEAPEINYEAVLRYVEGLAKVPNIVFRFSSGGSDLFTFKSKFTSVYPELDALFSMGFSEDQNNNPMWKSGELRVTADMAHLSDHAFNGTVKLTSNIEGFENWWGELETKLAKNRGKIEGQIKTLLTLNELQYKGNLEGSLELNRKFDLMYKNQYEFYRHNNIEDRKDIDLRLILEHENFKGKITVLPTPNKPNWSMYVQYDHDAKKFTGYVMPGDTYKYELTSNLSEKGLALHAQRISPEGVRFKVLQGNINWNMRKLKKQITINMNSDIEAIRKITGQIIVQQRRGMAANAKVRVNNGNFIGNVRYIPARQSNAGRVTLKVNNDIYLPFKSDTTVNFSSSDGEYASDVTIDVGDTKEYVTVSFKASITELFIHLKTPHFGNMEASIEVDLSNGYEVDMKFLWKSLCFDFKGLLSKRYRVAKIATKFQQECNTTSDFEFNFTYDVDSKPFDISIDCFSKEYGQLFEFSISGILHFRNASVLIEGKVYPNFSRAITIKWDVDSFERYRFDLRAYDSVTDDTYFRYRKLFSPNKFNLEIIVSEDQQILIETDYDFSPEELMVNATYSHQLFGFPFNAELQGKAEIDSSGVIEAHLKTDSTFDHVDVTIDYDFSDTQRVKGLKFKVLTTNGNAEGNVTLEKDELLSLKFDMLSSLHTFEKYHMELVYGDNDDHQQLKIQSKQDDIEFHLEGHWRVVDDRRMGSVSLTIPFDGYDHYDFEFSYPQVHDFDVPYQAHISITVAGESYALDIVNTHAGDYWSAQENAITFSTSSQNLGNYTVSILYDLDGRAAANLITSQGTFGIEGSFTGSSESFSLNAMCDLSLFDLGKYIIESTIPLKPYYDCEILIKRDETNVDFNAYFFLDETYKFGNISLNVIESKEESQTKSYGLTYNFQEALALSGHFDKWSVMMKGQFKGRRNPSVSGIVSLTTDVPGYETIEGSWNAGKKKGTYYVQIKLNTPDEDIVVLDASLNSLAKGGATPWRNANFDFKMESPHTWTHHFQGEYQALPFSVMGTYQYGLDTFNFHLDSRFQQKNGNLKLSGNIPVPGISSFIVDMNYNFDNSYIANAKVAAEETSFDVNFEIASELTRGSLMASLRSPFVIPVETAVGWSFLTGQVNADVTWKAGKHSGGLKTSLQWSDISAAQFDIQLNSSFVQLSKLSFKFNYNLVNSEELQGSASFSLNDYIVKGEFQSLITDSKKSLKISGSMTISDVNGLLTIELDQEGDVYKCKFGGKLYGYDPLNFTLTVDPNHIDVSAKYGTANGIDAYIDFDKTTMNLKWREHHYTNLTMKYGSITNGNTFDFELSSSEFPPITLAAMYLNSDGYEGNIKLKVGEKEYNINGKMKLRKKKSSLEIRFDSMQDPHHPILFDVAYDFAGFMQGRMRSMADLASASFEWGDRMHLSVKGMRNKSRSKIHFELGTPFRVLPQVKFGYEGEFTVKKNNIDISLTTFVEWSEKIALTGFFKDNGRKLNLNWTLTTPYRSFEKMSLALQVRSGHVDSQITFNESIWKFNCDYEISPKFSVTLSAETPISGFDNLIFTASGGIENSELRAETAFSWPGDNTVRLILEAKVVDVRVEIQTPWEPLKDIMFTFTVKTESEELMCNTDLVWDSGTADIELTYSPARFRLVGNYLEDDIEVVYTRFEYSLRREEWKMEAEMRSPSEFLRNLDALFQFSAENLIIRLDLNDVTSLVEGDFSTEKIAFMADIPYLGGFLWTLDVSNIQTNPGFPYAIAQWMDIYSNATFTLPRKQVPFSIVFKYSLQPTYDAFTFETLVEIMSDKKWLHISSNYDEFFDLSASFHDGQVDLEITNPEHGMINMIMKAELPDLDVDLLKLNLTTHFDESFESLDVSGSMSLEMKDQQISLYNFMMTCDFSANSLVLDCELEINRDAYKLQVTLPLFNVLMEEGKASFSLTLQEFIYSASYETVYAGSSSVDRSLIIATKEWSASFLAKLNDVSLTMTFVYPEPTDQHSVLITWSDISLERLDIGIGVNSPLLTDGAFNFNIKFEAQDQFYYQLTSTLSYGEKSTDIKGHFQYNRGLRQIVCKGEVSSNVLGNHHMDAYVKWMNDIELSVTLNIIDKEHFVKVHIDPKSYKLEITITSPWLPDNKLIINGKVDTPFELNEMHFEGEVNTGSEEFKIEGYFYTEGFENTNSSLTVSRYGRKMLSAKANSYMDHESTEVVFEFWRTYSPHFRLLPVSMDIEYKDSPEERRFKVQFNQFYSTYHFHFAIVNSKSWLNLQEFKLDWSNVYYINNRFSFQSDYGYLYINFDHDVIFNLDYNLDKKTNVKVYFDSFLEAFRNFKFYFKWPVPREQKEFSISFWLSQNEYYLFSMKILPDQLMGWSPELELYTPIKGYERFALRFPKFKNGNTFFEAMIEYPGHKVGAQVYQKCPRRSSCDMRLNFHLPYEEYEIISLQYTVGSYRREFLALEGRIGKVGCTFSFRTLKDDPNTNGLELLIRVNEYKLKVTGGRYDHNRMADKYYFDIDFNQSDFEDYRSFYTELYIDHDNEYHLLVKRNYIESFKVRYAWGREKAFTIITPKVYPGRIVVNLESTQDLNDLHLLAAFPVDDVMWETYGVHAHQSVLEGGRHISLSGEVGETQFGFEGTLSFNNFHLNNSLLIELNRKKTGYVSVFQRQPGLFKSLLTGEFALVLPEQTAYCNASLTSERKALEILSYFTWDETDPEKVPVHFALNYDDKTIFGQGARVFKAVFTHPKIEDITLQGNFTKTKDSPLSVIAELVDKNAPERDIIITMVSEPSTQNEEHHINFSVSQPLSGFAVVMEAQITNSVFDEAEYVFKFWSLKEEEWKYLHMSTSVNSSDNGCEFAAEIYTPQSKWGYSFIGDMNSKTEALELNFQGISKEFEDFWKFGAFANKHMPRISTQLEIGQSGSTAYEKGRLRVGMHNPLEIGAILDHQRFGEWKRDGAFGVRLLPVEVLEFFFKYDPSLDYRDESLLTQLTSPADKIASFWLRDILSTFMTTKDWIAAEGPTAIEVLLDTPTLEIIVREELINLQNFVYEVDRTITQYTGLVTTAWTDFVKPVLQVIHNYTADIYLILENTLESWIEYLQSQIDWESILPDMESMTQEMSALADEFSAWALRLSHDMTVGFKTLMYELVRGMNIAVNSLHDSFIVIQDFFEPYIAQMTPIFIRYGQELDAVFGGQCVERIRQKFESLKQSLNEGRGAVAKFLQLDEYYRRALELQDAFSAWFYILKSYFVDGVSQLQETIEESYMIEQVDKMYDEFLSAIFEINHVGLYAYMEPRLEPSMVALRENLQRAYETLQEKVTEFKEQYRGNIAFEYMDAAAGNIYERLVAMWQRWKVDARRDLASFQRLVVSFSEVVGKIMEEENKYQKESFILEPDHGNYVYFQHLPVPWNNFLEMPEWYRLGYLFGKESAASKARRALASGVDDTSSVLWAMTLPGAFRPPFTATATIMGQHVTTFDLRHFQFLGSCSYVLTKDFQNDDFEVVGQYVAEEGVINLDSVVVRGANVDITIHTDGSVQSRQEGSAEVFIEEGRSTVRFNGILVTCNALTRGCSFTVAGKYFGRLSGLLGNYNYEPSDDFMGPDGTKAAGAADHARRWSVSPQPCYQANQATYVHLEDLDGAKGLKECSRLFLHKNSPFSACFSFLDPRPYFWQCLNDRNNPHYNEDGRNASCSASLAYRTQCWPHGIRLLELDQCREEEEEEPVISDELPPRAAPAAPPSAVAVGTCDVDGEAVPTGWSETYEAETEGSADVAFIIELGNCNKGKTLQKLLKMVNVQLKRSGIQDVRYALVTVKEGTVSVPTAFGTDVDLDGHLANLDPEGPKAADGGAQAVIDTAKTLKWRPGVSRTIIHLSCQMCDAGDEVAEALRSQDVTYHLLTKFKVVMRGPNPKKSKAMAAKLFGFDETNVFTAADVKNFRGNPKLRTLLEVPESSCLSAIEASGGSIFNTNKWITAKAPLEKKFLLVASQRLSKSGVTPECQDCRCLGDVTDASVSCRKCSDPHPDEEQEVMQVQQLPQLIQQSDANLSMQNVQGEYLTKWNTTVNEEIKKYFEETFVEENAALSQIKFAMDENAGGESDSWRESYDADDNDDGVSSYEDDYEEDDEEYEYPYYDDY